MKRPTTVMMKKNAKLAKRRAEVPAPADGVPIGDGPEKYDTGRDVLVPDVQSGDDVEYTVSPFRAMLADRGKTIRTGSHVPTEKTRKGVMYALGLGLTQEAVAKVMGISVATLANHYREELDSAIHVMMSDIQSNLYNIARDRNHKDSVKSGIFLLSKLGGEVYREKKAVELTGKDGQPLQIDSQTRTVDPTLLSHEQRDALRDILSSAMKLAQQPAPVQLEGDYKEVEE